MKQTLRPSKTLAVATMVIGGITSFSAAGFAGTVRDHRGMASPVQTSSQLPCGSYKYCAKQGVIVRDHRTGAAPSGK